MTAKIGMGMGALAILALAFIGWPASLFIDHDFVQYWLAGHALLSGQDPYDPDLWRALHAHVGSNGSEIAPGAGFLYPAVTAVAVMPLSLLPFSLAAAAWFVASVASALVALVALGRKLFTVRPRWDLAVLLLFAAVIRPDYLLPIDGNITDFLVGIVGGAIALLLRGRAVAAGALLGLAIVKPHLLIVFVPSLLLFVEARERVRLLTGALLTAATLLTISLALAPAWPLEWARQSLRIGNYARTNLWGIMPADSPWLAAMVAIGLVLGLVAWWRVTRPSLAVACGASIAVSLLLAPYAFMIDQAVLLVSVAAIVGLVQDLPPLSRNVILLIVVALASPWYMGALIGLVPINVLRLAPVLVVLAVTILMQAYLRWSVRAPAAVFASAPGS